MSQDIGKNTSAKTAAQNSSKPDPLDGMPFGDMPWNGSFDDPWGANNQGDAKLEKQLTPQERVEMIEKVYKRVLGRKPDTRDINYYKYSTLSEAEISDQLITGKEHKDLMKHGREHKSLKKRVETAENKVKTLEGNIKDQIAEFSHLTTLLEEKNKLITQLRAGKPSPFKYRDQDSSTQDQYIAVSSSQASTSTVNTEFVENEYIPDYDTGHESFTESVEPDAGFTLVSPLPSSTPTYSGTTEPVEVQQVEDKEVTGKIEFEDVPSTANQDPIFTNASSSDHRSDAKAQPKEDLVGKIRSILAN